MLAMFLVQVNLQKPGFRRSDAFDADFCNMKSSPIQVEYQNNVYQFVVINVMFLHSPVCVFVFLRAIKKCHSCGIWRG